MTSPRALVLTLATALASPAALAADDAPAGPFSLTVTTGAEYDSNVAVLELDTSSGEGDVAALFDLDAGFDKNVTRRLNLKLGYAFSQSLHDEFDEFDVRIHRGSGGMGYDFGGVDAGVTLQYADAALDNDPYLTLKQVSPYLSKLFGRRLFLRLAWARTDKEFDTDPARDATADAPSIDAFVFFSGTKTYLTLGYEFDDEDATDDQFDYTGSKLKAQLSRRFAPRAREVTLKAGLRYESRDYDEPAAPPLPLPPGAPPREDRRYRFETELKVALSEHFFLRARYEYADNRSNLSGVDFDEHVASLGVGAKLESRGHSAGAIKP